MVLFSQYLNKAWIPIPTFSKGQKFIRFKVFALFPVLLTILIMWAICGLCTLADIQDQSIRVDGAKSDIFRKSKWFRIPYPCMNKNYNLKINNNGFQSSGAYQQCQWRECLE